MATQDDEQLGVIMGLLVGVILLVVSLVFGISLYQTNKSTTARAAGPLAAVAATPSAAGSPAAASAAAASDEASVRVEDGVVKFYFASGKAELAAGAPEALGEVVKGVAVGKVAVISGYHDATGGAVRNEELAKQRALAVRDALLALGIGEDKLELRKPEVATADGSNADARRVEVTLE